MNPVFSAALELQAACQKRKWKFCFIGGIAVQRWSEPRLTLDADLTLLTGYGREEEYIAPLMEIFAPRRADAAEFAIRNRVLLLQSAQGIGFDIALGGVPFEINSINRSSPFRISKTKSLMTCSAEDLVVHKVFAGRPKDWIDVEAILFRRLERLDLGLVRKELKGLSALSGEAVDFSKFEIAIQKSRSPLTRITPVRRRPKNP
jgi:hypothetical protein